MDWQVSRHGTMMIDGREVRAALGKNGCVTEADKREGDGATPLGRYEVRWVYYRADRGEAPACALPVRATRPDDGWCDEPGDAAYNRLVRLPYPASCETLQREDPLYDIILVLGHNDDPAVAGLGSAIFLHCRRGDYEPTQGCVALDEGDVRDLLKRLSPGDRVVIS